MYAVCTLHAIAMDCRVVLLAVVIVRLFASCHSKVTLPLSVGKRSEIGNAPLEVSSSGSADDNEVKLSNSGDGGSGDGEKNSIGFAPTVPTSRQIPSDFLDPYCVPISLDSLEFTYLDDNSVIFRGETVQVIFWTMSGNPVVCSSFGQNGTILVNMTTNITTVELVFPKGFAIASYVGCSLSVLGSFFLLVTHSLFKELRTLPSLLLMSLTVAFLMGDLLILLGSSLTSITQRAPCIVVAILLHYWFLARFCWSNVIAFEMVRSFTSATKLLPVISTSAKKTIYVVYSAVGWGVPLIITLISVIVNFTTDNLVRYGTETCWINDVNSALAVFVAPLVISLFLNILSFVWILFNLCKGQIQNRNVGKSQLNIRLYLAVFSVMGLTWIFGFVAILSRSSWAWYPFIVLNSTQALLVALSFTCTKKVARYYLELFFVETPATSSVPGKTSSSNKISPSTT